MADAYSVATLAISRAGMMTVAELAAWGIPSILIPLPTAAADHQTPNAKVMEAAGAAIHLPQRDFPAGSWAACPGFAARPPDALGAMAAEARSEAAPTPPPRFRLVSGFFRGRGGLSQVAVLF